MPADRSGPKILVIRRDNIGDLILTTPLLAALRKQFPSAYIAALVNSYNAPVLSGNPHVDSLFAYTKGKHAARGGALGAHLRRLRLIWSLRRARFDFVILPNVGASPRVTAFARWVGARHVLGFTDFGEPGAVIDWSVRRPSEGRHEVENMFELMPRLGWTGGAIPGLTLTVDQVVLRSLHERLPAKWCPGKGPLIALHISARKPPQRWPIENFAALARALHAQFDARFLLFWSPGDENNPLHPGDDQKAKRLLDTLAGLPIVPVPTQTLSELIAGLSLVDYAILSDGGAMHVAAGLNKPIVAFFGNSSATRWRPWGVPYRVLQPESCDVSAVSVEQAFQAFDALKSDLVQS